MEAKIKVLTITLHHTPKGLKTLSANSRKHTREHPKRNATVPGHELLPTPVRHVVVSLVSQLLLLGAVGEHGPDLAVTVDLSLKHDVPAIGSKAGKIVATRITGKLQPALAGDVHYVDILPAGRARTVFAVPTEGQHRAARRPRRRDGISPVGHAQHVRPV